MRLPDCGAHATAEVQRFRHSHSGTGASSCQCRVSVCNSGGCTFVSARVRGDGRLP